jgi:hypothetical protein
MGAVMGSSRKLLSAVRALIVSSAYVALVYAGSVDDELRSRAHTEGLGIAWFAAAGRLDVHHFDRVGAPESLFLPGLTALYDIEPTSQVVLGSMTRLGASGTVTSAELFAPRFALFFLRGAEPTPSGLRQWPRSASISPQGKSLAALMVDSQRHRVSLQYGDLAWTTVHTVYALDLGDDPEHLAAVNYVEENFGWSPDSRSLVYSKQGHVYIFDSQAQSNRSMAEGSDPCWSPDGKFITYRSAQHALMIYALADGTSRTLSRDDVLGFPRWSPDSGLILFTRFSHVRAALDLITHDATDFVALRVSDGASAVAFEPRNGSDNRRFFWIKTGRRN